MTCSTAVPSSWSAANEGSFHSRVRVAAGELVLGGDVEGHVHVADSICVVVKPNGTYARQELIMAGSHILAGSDIIFIPYQNNLKSPFRHFPITT